MTVIYSELLFVTCPPPPSPDLSALHLHTHISTVLRSRLVFFLLCTRVHSNAPPPTVPQHCYKTKNPNFPKQAFAEYCTMQHNGSVWYCDGVCDDYSLDATAYYWLSDVQYQYCLVHHTCTHAHNTHTHTHTDNNPYIQDVFCDADADCHIYCKSLDKNPVSVCVCVCQFVKTICVCLVYTCDDDNRLYGVQVLNIRTHTPTHHTTCTQHTNVQHTRGMSFWCPTGKISTHTFTQSSYVSYSPPLPHVCFRWCQHVQYMVCAFALFCKSENTHRQICMCRCTWQGSYACYDVYVHGKQNTSGPNRIHTCFCVCVCVLAIYV